MRELVGECHPLAVIACSRNRLTWHVREEAGSHDAKSSFGNSKVINEPSTDTEGCTGG